MDYEIIELIIKILVLVVYIVALPFLCIENYKNKKEHKKEKEIQMEEKEESLYYTVESLNNILEDLIKEGYENKYVVVPCDDEGNDYRALGDQAVLKTKEDIEDYLGRDGKDASSLYLNIEDCIIL